MWLDDEEIIKKQFQFRKTPRQVMYSTHTDAPARRAYMTPVES